LLAIAILLVELCCGQTDKMLKRQTYKQTDGFECSIPTPTDIVGVGNEEIRRVIYSLTIPNTYNKREMFVHALLSLYRYLYAQGRNIWKKWKKRYYVLVQVCT